MKKILFSIVLSIVTLVAQGAELPKGYAKTDIGKKADQLTGQMGQDNPLSAFLSMISIAASGKEGELWQYLSPGLRMYYPEKGAPDKKVSEEHKNAVLSQNVKELLVCGDSIAAVITTMDNREGFAAHHYIRVRDKWYSTGSTERKTLEEVYIAVSDVAGYHRNLIRRISAVMVPDPDPAAYVDHLKKHGSVPQKYILDKLSTYPVVMYGEWHFRPLSWKLISSVITDKKFPSTTGVVFMEFGDAYQSLADEFMDSPTFREDLLLRMFRQQQFTGWTDKGQYDFMATLWRVNRELPRDKKIKLVMVDAQYHWEAIEGIEEIQEDRERNRKRSRNRNMAEHIEAYMRNAPDKRGGLFIVGTGHANKSAVKLRDGSFPEKGAGALLADKMGADKVFCISTHGPLISNLGRTEDKIGYAFFDRVFRQNGDKPVAFDLKGNIFGARLYDGMLESKYDTQAGTFQDNYDGYIFLGPLLTEEPAQHLDLYSDEFVEEIKRRARIMGIEDETWNDVKYKDLTGEKAREIARKWNEEGGATRWEEYNK